MWMVKQSAVRVVRRKVMRLVKPSAVRAQGKGTHLGLGRRRRAEGSWGSETDQLRAEDEEVASRGRREGASGGGDAGIHAGMVRVGQKGRRGAVVRDEAAEESRAGRRAQGDSDSGCSVGLGQGVGDSSTPVQGESHSQRQLRVPRPAGPLKRLVLSLRSSGSRP